MSTGDQSDILSRLRNNLPPSWFGYQVNFILDSSGDPLLDSGGNFIEDGQPLPAVLSGLLSASADVSSFIYSLITYSKLQTRLKTMTDGWLDLAAYDFFGLRIQRLPGQSDSSFLATILIELFRIRNTRAAIDQVLFGLTGHHPVIFEPWRPADTGGLNSTSLYYGGPGAFGSRSLPYTVFVKAYRGNGASDAQIYAAVSSVHMAGTTYWVQILNP